MPVVRKEQVYLQKLSTLNAQCKRCIKTGRFVSHDRCDHCVIGRRLRMLEAEYADITGWKHSKW